MNKSTVVHRLSTTQEFDRGSKRYVLCGAVTAIYASHAEAVTCKTCIRSAKSDSTIKLQRIAKEMR